MSPFDTLAKAPTLFDAAHIVRICEPLDMQEGVPDFDGPGCRDLPIYQVNPQHTYLWLRLTFDRSSHWQRLTPPYGVFVLGKAASRVYLNGQLLGNNGTPAADKQEVPGTMDKVLYLPEVLLKDTGNEMVLELSGQHSLMELGYPLHFIGFGHYHDPRLIVQQYRGMGLILTGAFLLGALYFFTASYGRLGHRHQKLFGAMCLIAALQLLTEMSRGLVPYTYPWHDVRLVTVTILSLLFGMSILVYSSYKTMADHALHWIYTGLLVTVTAILLAPGFDSKTTAGVFFPLLVSLIQLLIVWRRQRQKARLGWFLVQLLIVITIVANQASFHEIIHFLIIAMLLMYLFVQQAKEYRLQQQQSKDDQQLIAKLEYKLAQNSQSDTPARLEVSSAGKTLWVPVSDILYCKAAGDYAELHLIEQGEKLYSGSLKQLEAQLPNTFIRVHRSFLVNLEQVVALSGKTVSEAGGYHLQLTDGQAIPVSRRLMPTVRSSLKQESAAVLMCTQ
ncbi:LytTR family DNA-binding domain-containing protein [uncultured Microbulbifer sp.]|uniref:LytR/AlgR family response regulator transcription factor n=1 Tax=uncultured Microbulbifer sp. TaxID=348147 RepID=UPI002602A198|nr:LytTR family DNA-binding domain-containing protein [uncultured Microbulbifer sp.]